MKKKTIRTQIATISPHDFDGSIKVVIVRLFQIVVDHPDHINISIEYDSFRSYDDSIEFNVYGDKKESDEAFAKRKLRNKKNKESAKKAAITKKSKEEEKDKIEYERLKKKYQKK